MPLDDHEREEVDSKSARSSQKPRSLREVVYDEVLNRIGQIDKNSMLGTADMRKFMDESMKVAFHLDGSDVGRIVSALEARLRKEHSERISLSGSGITEGSTVNNLIAAVTRAVRAAGVKLDKLEPGQKRSQAQRIEAKRRRGVPPQL